MRSKCCRALEGAVRGRAADRFGRRSADCRSRRRRSGRCGSRKGDRERADERARHRPEQHARRPEPARAGAHGSRRLVPDVECVATRVRQLRRGIPADRYTREYFLSDQCDGFHEFEAGRGLSYVKQRFVERLGEVAGERVLEIGCGRGEVLWVNTQGYMGMKFYLLEDQDKRSLSNWLEAQEHTA